MKKLFILLTIIVLCLESFNLFSQDYTKHPGYVDFGDLDGFKKSEETVEVFIKGPLLKFVAKATENEDPSLSQLLNDLLLIKVDVFSMEGNEIKDVKSVIDKVSKKLMKGKWERMVRVREKDEHVEVFTQFENEEVLSGLVVMALEDNDDAVFVNIVGKIDPAQLGKLSTKFNIPKLDSIHIEAKTKK